MSGPAVDIPCQSVFIGTRPRCGLSPNSPQHAAGMRIEPAPSVPSAAAASPAATAAPEPPLEPPGRAGEIPRVARRAERERLRHRQRLELRHVRLAQRHGARGAQPADDLGVGGDRSAVGERAAGGDLARHVGVVLDRDRHAVERRGVVAAPAIGGVGRGERLVGEHHAIGVQRGIEPLDPLQVQLGQLARRHLAVPDQLGLAGEPGEGEIGGVHGGDPSDSVPPHGRPERGGAPRGGVQRCGAPHRRRGARRPARPRPRGVGGDPLGAAPAPRPRRRSAASPRPSAGSSRSGHPSPA